VERSTVPLFTGVIPETGIHGIPRERQYDVVAATEAPDVEGDAARFVALEDGSLLVEEGDGDLTTLADAIEQEIARPYRATAVRRGETTWAARARRRRGRVGRQRRREDARRRRQPLLRDNAGARRARRWRRSDPGCTPGRHALGSAGRPALAKQQREREEDEPAAMQFVVGAAAQRPSVPIIDAR